jgi:trehalose 6-phosphate phosphatase
VTSTLVQALTQTPPSSVLLATDFDGTLSSIALDPDLARPVPGAVEVLQALSGVVGEVVILTGRSRQSIAQLIDLSLIPDVRVLCLYGQDDLSLPAPESPPEIAQLRLLLNSLDLPAGVRIEEKVLSLAVHTRQCDDPAAALVEVEELITPHAHSLGIGLERGRFVLDAGMHFGGKAFAMADLLREREWGGAIMIGDDRNDLGVFDLLQSQSLLTARVGVSNPEVPELLERVDILLDSPEEVVRWLEGLLAHWT